MKTKLMIGSEILGKVTENGKFSCAVCSKGVGSSSILCQFFQNWVHKSCSSIIGKLKGDNKFKCEICAIQRTNSRELSRRKIKLPVSWKYFVVVVTQYELEGVQMTMLS